MLRNGFVIVLAVGILFGGLLSPASAVTPAQANTIAARQAALMAARKHHKHHHHKKPTAGVVK
jgi:hypothetical protein